MPRPSPQTDRVIALTRLLAAHADEGFTITEIARRLHVNKATCYPMLGALTESGWVVRDPVSKTYRLGPALIPVGEAAGRSFPAARLARPTMLELSEELGVSCAAFTPSDGHATLADQVWDVRSTIPPLRIGQWITLRAPFGSAFVAWGDEEAVAAWLAGVPAAQRDHFRDALSAIRRRGFVVELRTPPEERIRERWTDEQDPAEGIAPPDAVVQQLVDELAAEPEFLPLALDASRAYDVSTIGAPVFDSSGRMCLHLALLGFSGARSGDAVAHLGTRLRGAADELSASLGHAVPR